MGEVGPTIEDLQRSADSIIANIGALRMSFETIEELNGRNRLLWDLLVDCREALAGSGGYGGMVARIDRTLHAREQ